MQRTVRSGVCLAGLIAVISLANAQQTKESPPPLGTASFTPPESKKHEPLTPENFVVRAAVSNLAEIEASELALQKSADADIRALAKRLVAEHRAAQTQLKTVAAEGKIALPGTVDEDHRKQQQKLSELVGADFDRAYLEHMQSGHEATLQLYREAADADLPASHKQYASSTAKVVEGHRDALNKLRASSKR